MHRLLRVHRSSSTSRQLVYASKSACGPSRVTASAVAWPRYNSNSSGAGAGKAGGGKRLSQKSASSKPSEGASRKPALNATSSRATSTTEQTASPAISTSTLPLESIAQSQVQQPANLAAESALDDPIEAFSSIDEAAQRLFVGLEESIEDLLPTPDYAGMHSTQVLPAISAGDTETAEKEWASSIVHGRGAKAPFYHQRTTSIPVATIQFRTHYSPYHLELFTHFASHAAASLGIPISKVIMLPRERRLWTVIRGPFVHKKSQENFERRTYKRAIKAWDAHPDVVDLWIGYIRKHAMAGVGMRITRWDRKPIGFGRAMMLDLKAETKALPADKVRALGEKIVELESPQTEQQM